MIPGGSVVGWHDAALTLSAILLDMKKPGAYVAGMPVPELLSADELPGLNFPGKRIELVRGRLVLREPSGFRHGVVAMRVAARLQEFVTQMSLGVVVAAETGFRLFSDPDTVRAPDAAFIRADRIPGTLPRGFADFAPDLIVEVLSPDDRPGEVLAKVGDWLEAGCRLVWVLDPERRIARVYRTDGSESLLSADDVIQGEGVLTGFACRVGALV